MLLNGEAVHSSIVVGKMADYAVGNHISALRRAKPKSIVLFDTSCGSQNLGDYIICEAVERELAFILKDSFCIHIPTHTPASGLSSRLFGGLPVASCNSADIKFICGTNILSTAMVRLHPNWNINLFDCGPYRGAVCVGCGSSLVRRKYGVYERVLYRRILSKQYTHSVRDDRTARMLNQLGLHAINTGCPTTWSLTQGQVDATYQRVGDRPPMVLFTSTDYAVDPEQDREIINTLLTKYETVLFWPQGLHDYNYMDKIGMLDKVVVVPPNLKAYRSIMDMPFDYVGTRLHGGIYALLHGHRTIIIAVDHRAKDLSATSGIPVISRGSRRELLQALEFVDIPQITIPTEAICEWKAQFSSSWA